VADEVTLGELGRRLDALGVQLGQLVGRAEYDAHRHATDRQIAELEKDQSALATRLDEIVRRMDERYEQISTQQRAHEDARASQQSQTRVALITAFVAPVVVAVFLLFLRSQGLAS
jgi:hypothetical protein